MSNTAKDIFGSSWRDEQTQEELEFIEELEQMQTVVESDAGGGYDWDVYYVYWHTGRKRYYVVAGGGCSCYWISDGVDSLGDFQEFGTAQEVLKDFKSSHKESGYGWSKELINRTANAIRDFKG